MTTTPQAKPPSIILTGFMATGKSTVGRILARLLDYNFVDTDSLIEAKQRQTIPEIFSCRGEDYFRRLETDLAHELAEQNALVIATGGKFMLDPVNSEVLTKSGIVFNLVATAEEILERLLNDTANSRPLLAVPDPKAKIVELLKERGEGYSKFHRINTSNKSPKEIAEEIFAEIQQLA